eukprot:7540241-Alexandrium_andersonii.AAC.1
MSASLVGSEMCIRDRCRSDGGLSLPPLAVLLGRQLSPDVGRYLRRPFVPVSYTHLTLPTICSV